MKHRHRKHQRLINELIIAFDRTDQAKRRARLARQQRDIQPLRRI
ncbi:hypothetical protein [Methylobacter marinus]|nr:hypothetical protein [Methylobacter marinus]